MKAIKIKRFGASLALVSMSLIVAIITAELVLRHFYPIGISSALSFRMPHPVFGWVLEPDASYINKIPENTVRVTYNSAGWRDVEHSLEKERGVFRILVLGDSFMEGYSVELEDVFHRKLEGLARKEGVDMEVINLGVGGYGTLQEYLVFRDIGQFFKPDIVLLGFYIGNDVRNNSLYLESESIFNKKSVKVTSRPFLDPGNNGEWAVSQVDFDGAWQRYSVAKINREANARREPFSQRLANRSALIQALLRAVKQEKTVPRETGHTASKRKVTVTSKMKAWSSAMFGVNYCKERPEYTRAWLATKRILDRLNGDVANIGGELFVFTVPALHEVDAELIKDVPLRELICWEKAPGYARLKGILNELDIGYVDLLPGIRKIISDNGLDLYNRSDRHWNAKGHHLAAETVYSALKNRGLLH